MIFKNIQRIVLFSLLVSFSVPVHAFWGEGRLSRWVSTATSYVADVFARPAEHKVAIFIGTVATLGVGAVIVSAYRRAQEQAAQEAERIAREEVARLEELATNFMDQSGRNQFVPDRPQEVESIADAAARLEQERRMAEQQRIAQEQAEQLRLQQEAERVRLQRERRMAERQREAQVEAERLAREQAARLETERLAEAELKRREDQEQKELLRLRQVAAKERVEQAAPEELQRIAFVQAAVERRVAELQREAQVEAERLRQEEAESQRLKRLQLVAGYLGKQHVSPGNIAPLGAMDMLLQKAQSADEKRRAKKNAEKERVTQVEQGLLFNGHPGEMSATQMSAYALTIAKPFKGSPSSSSSSSPSSSRSPSPEVQVFSDEAQSYIDSLGQDRKTWPVAYSKDEKKNRLSQEMRQSFLALSLDLQQEIIHWLRIQLNDGKALPTENSQEGFFQGLINACAAWWNGGSKPVDLFEECYLAVRQQAYLAIPLGDLEVKHHMTPEKKGKISALLQEAIDEAQEEPITEAQIETQRRYAMGLSASNIKDMEAGSNMKADSTSKLHFMVRIFKPSKGKNTGKIALFVPIHGTFADSGNYGSGTNNYDNGPRLMAAAQRMADAKGVTLHVIIPNWNSQFDEGCREEAACYISPLIHAWYEMFKNQRIAFIDLLGHSEGNSVITLMLKGMANVELKKHIRWLSVCPTAGSDYIPVGCKARVTIWSPADALAFIASLIRFSVFRKLSGLNVHVDSLFTNISLSYNGIPENHVTAKYRACALYDTIFDIAERFKGHCELSMDVNAEHNEILVAARRGKESCLESMTKELTELLCTVSELAEDRYRAVYPENRDWHQKPHDFASFAIRYPHHGASEKDAGDKEDNDILEGGKEASRVQATHYQNEMTQVESQKRIHYGWDNYVERVSPVDVGEFVHNAFVGDASLQAVLERSRHRKEFLAALISYWNNKGSRDSFVISGTKALELFRFFTRDINRNVIAIEKGERCVNTYGSNHEMRPNYEIDLHGLPRENDCVQMSEWSDWGDSKVLVKLCKRQTNVQAVQQGGQGAVAGLCNWITGSTPKVSTDSAILSAKEIELSPCHYDQAKKDSVQRYLIARRVLEDNRSSSDVIPISSSSSSSSSSP